MAERRLLFTFVPQLGEPQNLRHRDRRRDERREHRGAARILFIDLAKAWARFRAAVGDTFPGLAKIR